MSHFPESVQKLWMFYCGLSSGNKSAIWLANGCLFGSIYGPMDRLKAQAEAKTDYLEITEFSLDGRNKMKEFERSWNDSAKRNQVSRGYGWTRMYKAIAWDESPFHYLSMRMWEDKPVEDQIFLKEVEANKSVKSVKRKQYVTVIDDSVIRTIN